MIEFVQQKSTPFGRPAHLPLPVTGTRRRRPVRVRRRRATRPLEVPPAVRRQLAVRFGSRTRWMPEQAIGATSRLQGVVGRTTGPHRVTTVVPGRGRIVVRHCRKLLVLGLRRRDGRHARVVSVLRRYGQVSGLQGKGAHVLVLRPRTMQTAGGLVGDQPQAIAVVRRHRSNDAGAKVQLTSSHRPPPTCCRSVVRDATSVVVLGVILFFMILTRCRRLCDATFVDGQDAIRPATGQVSGRQCQMCQTSQQVQLRDQPGMQPVRSQTGSGARTRASGPRRPVSFHALSRIRRSLCLR